MKLVVGLGNPGRKYGGTRHNVGFDIVDVLAERHRAEWEAAPRGVEALVARWRAADTVLAKPLTFMNLSGTAIVGLLNFYKIDPAGLLVVVDDVVTSGATLTEAAAALTAARPDGPPVLAAVVAATPRRAPDGTSASHLGVRRSRRVNTSDRLSERRATD